MAGLLPASLRERTARLLGLRQPEAPAVAALQASIERRLRQAALEHEAAWLTVRDKDDWERFRDERINALRRSLGRLPEPGQAPAVRLTGERHLDGVVVENLLIERRPAITANLYRPTTTTEPAPAIVICHSHHADKTQRELQDMGLLWARAGCVVLIPDVFGHGERRLHPFDTAADYRLPFKLERQDYYFRFNLGWQLELAGLSLMGQMVGDVSTVLDALIARPEVDPDRLVLIGSVAGGGDIAAAAAALDHRVRVLVPFGYRGRSLQGDGGEWLPGPDRGSWELSRNLSRSVCDGFLPWVVLAARAPRPLVYAHEFAWDAANDPVWTRLQQVYALYGAADQLAVIHGRGSGAGPPPENTHCTNVGRVHRLPLHPILERWLDIPLPREGAQTRCDGRALRCLEPGRMSPPDLLGVIAEELTARSPAEALREGLQALLGREAGDSASPPSTPLRAPLSGGERLQLAVDGDVTLELELLWPRGGPRPGRPTVVGFCQQGGRALGRKRRSLVRRLRAAGVALCLTDLRGTGPASGESTRGRSGLIVEVAASELMLGQTLLGARLNDLQSVLRYLRSRAELAGSGFLLWGDSLAAANPATADLVVPFDAGPFPALSEPMGGLVALLAGLVEPDIRAVMARGTWARLASLLESPLCYSPVDAVVPGLAALCEIDDLAAAQAPRPLLLDGLVDGRNRTVDGLGIERAFEHTRGVYAAADASADLRLRCWPDTDRAIARWVLDRT